MNNFEIHAIAFSKDKKAAQAFHKETFTTDDDLQAMKCYVRDNLGMTFYYESWKENDKAYVFGDFIFCVVPAHLFAHAKLNIFTDVYTKYIKTKKEEKACDCGSEKTWGKGNGAHSNWCSAIN